MRRRDIILVISFFVFAVISNACAADSSGAKYPIAVLVQLRSEHNRVAALTAAGKLADVERVKEDGAGVEKAMIKDFQDHFNFCPVYYYMDTNADLIKKKVFDGVLMDADGNPAKNVAISNRNKKYLVVYYGYASDQPADAGGIKGANGSSVGLGEPMGQGLVINDNDLRQVAFFYKFGYAEPLFKTKANKGYYYQSKRYDMEYFPFARRFNKALKDRAKNIIKDADGS